MCLEGLAQMTMAHLEYDAEMFAAMVTVLQFLESETSCGKHEAEWN